VNTRGGSDNLTEYKYDLPGRRVLKRGAKVYSSGTPSQRTRYFFNGLTEEIRKVSVTGNGVSHSDTAFERTMKLDASEGAPTGWSDPYVAIEYNSARRSDVYKFTNWTMHGTGFWVPSPDNGYNITGKKTFSCWAKALTNASEVTIYFETNSARRAIHYRASTGAPFVLGNILYIQLGGTDQDYMNKWTRIERNIEADLKTEWPSENLVRVLGCAAWTGNASYPLYMDDLSFSNSMTTEHNVMGPGVIGHILRNRTTDVATYAATDRWFHYNQVGSVMCETDDTGALAQTHWQDAFGNTLSGWQTATWGGDRPGWHHNTKEFDDDIGLVYMYQRWYSPELGIFMSSAPYPPMMEHRYSFALHAPQLHFDPTGRRVVQASAGVGFTVPLTPFGLGIGGKLDVGYTWDSSGGWRAFLEPGIGPSAGLPGVGFHGGPATSSEPDAVVYDGWGCEGNAGLGPVQGSVGYSIKPGAPPGLASAPLLSIGAQTPTETGAVQGLITHRTSVDMILFTPQGMLGYAYGQMENAILNW